MRERLDFLVERKLVSLPYGSQLILQVLIFSLICGEQENINDYYYSYLVSEIIPLCLCIDMHVVTNHTTKHCLTMKDEHFKMSMVSASDI